MNDSSNPNDYSNSNPSKPINSSNLNPSTNSMHTLTDGEFNRALKLYLSNRGFKFNLAKPPANAEGEAVYGLYRRYPSRTKPIAKKTLAGWRNWFIAGGSIDELRR